MVAGASILLDYLYLCKKYEVPFAVLVCVDLIQPKGMLLSELHAALKAEPCFEQKSFLFNTLTRHSSFFLRVSSKDLLLSKGLVWESKKPPTYIFLSDEGLRLFEEIRALKNQDFQLNKTL